MKEHPRGDSTPGGCASLLARLVKPWPWPAIRKETLAGCPADECRRAIMMVAMPLQDYRAVAEEQRQADLARSVAERLEALGHVLETCRSLGLLPRPDPWEGVEEKVRLARALKKPWLPDQAASTGPR